MNKDTICPVTQMFRVTGQRLQTNEITAKNQAH